MRVLLGVPNYQLTTNFAANCQLITIFFAQLSVNYKFQLLLIFTLKRKIFHRNLNLLHFTEHAN